MERIISFEIIKISSLLRIMLYLFYKLCFIFWIQHVETFY